MKRHSKSSWLTGFEKIATAPFFGPGTAAARALSSGLLTELTVGSAPKTHQLD